MPRNSVTQVVGEKARKLLNVGGDREKGHKMQWTGSRMDNDEGRKRLLGSGSRENFQDAASDVDWLFGTLLIIVIIFALSPGVLLTLPPGAGKVLMSGNTSLTAAFTHAVIVALLFNYL